MSDHLQFLLLGLGAGGVFAALALALVIVYRSSGVINFATGSIALTGAYIYAFLREGELVLLIPGLPQSIDLGGDPGFVIAAVAAVAICGLLGLALYLVVFRPLRTAPPVARAVASIGVMILFAAATAAQVGANPVGVDAIFPVDIWEIGSIRVPQDRVLFALTIAVIAVALAGAYRFTRFGLLTRASAETEEGAFVSGLSPDRIAATNWIIGSAVAGLAGILISPIVPLTPMAYTLFVVPALAAAIIGRFSSILAAAGAGLAIGMLQSEATYLPRVYDWLPSTGLVELVPLVIVLVVLVAWARPLPSRGSVIVSELGTAPSPRRIVLGCAVPSVLVIVVLTVADGDWRAAVITSLILAVIGLSQVVVTGYAGQVSLAQLTIAGAGAFLVGPITADWGVPFPLAPLLAAVIATVIGVVVGLPALRVRGLIVAVVTLTMAYTIEAIWFRNDAFVGAAGVDVPAPGLFGLDLGIGSGGAYPRVQFGLLCLVVVVAVGLGVALLRRSQLGTQMLAVRANERSAAASGVDVVRIKLLAFGIGSFIAGLGGCLFAYQQTNVSFQPFTVILGVTFFATVYLAGVTSISGGVLSGLLGTGAVFYLVLDQLFGGTEYYQVIVGLALVVMVLFNPEGIVGPVHAAMARRRRRNGTERGMGSAVAEPGQLRGPRPATMGETVLALQNVTVRYGGVVAVDDVTISVPSGAIVGLIGPNGAGKTTLIDAVSGFVRSSGVITLGGDDLGGQRSHRRIRAGLGRTFQAIELYEDLSVRENLLVGLSGQGVSALAHEADLDEVLATVGLAEVGEIPAGELSQGQRQLVSIARALAGRPRVLMLDEPAGGLDSVESAWLGERLERIRDTGVTILLVEHDMSLVLAICDRIEVLNFGRILAGGTPAQIRADSAVADAYLGAHTDDTPPEEASPHRRPAVTTEGVIG
ncbi:branched-chain amino acid ABC transporter permease/ATP-binding protein [Gordonia sp. LSe1-13]|uniref:Branched-chain amino acid ABC transporter permease/ATP-binding protein n=1 Tax=Gordonia sesuvii TaxID=3116777 RepID=A0ABU7M9C2_9ACTN|nr:branched-chain amino acid ABC transporter permease/ATP-binding protein [Gordonia sp. LSe1-13]